jgi:hypothetical protein
MRLFLTFVFLIAIGCNAQRSNSGPDEFAEFFNRFQTDSTFQGSRVANPLKYRYLDTAATEERKDTVITEMPIVTEEIDTAEWKYRRLSVRENVRESFNGHSDPTAVSADADTVVFHLAGTDNGVNLRYEFARRDGEWHLVGILDESL